MQNKILNQLYEEFKNVLDELGIILLSEFSEDRTEENKERLEYFKELLQSINPDWEATYNAE